MSNHASIRVFIDSDVVISSLISKSGAAYTLLQNNQQLELYVSNLSITELEKVASRLRLAIQDLHDLINSQLVAINIGQSLNTVKQRFAGYVSDIDDAHIVAGAKEAKATFIVSYNIRDFKAEKINQDFQIVLLTPGLFLQYLRSL
ncbi:MAG: PIN domain-containing protein [Candidatus Saccharimonadales bacterium]